MQVDLRGISKHYGDSAALTDLDLVFPSAVTTALIGPSGCGKSTVLRLLVALIAPDAGEISVDGEPLATLDVIAWRRRIGYVIQEGGLFPHLSAGDNVTLMACHLGWDRVRTARRLEELVTLARFPREALGRYPTELSGGQRQRVGLMRALLLDPALVLLDEPLGAVDPLGRAELGHDLREIFHALGKTVVLVTHDVGEAAALADFVAVMRAGRVVQRGRFAEIAAAPADPFVAAFLTSGLASAQASALPAPAAPHRGSS
jgi:osmoprotectant transport system ATP-binding protein